MNIFVSNSGVKITRNTVQNTVTQNNRLWQHGYTPVPPTDHERMTIKTSPYRLPRHNKIRPFLLDYFDCTSKIKSEYEFIHLKDKYLVFVNEKNSEENRE